MGKYTILIGYASDTGNVRTQNQDSLLIKRGSIENDDFLLVAVADGMGGMQSGEVASQMIMAELNDWWQTVLSELVTPSLDMEKVSSSLSAVIATANEKIYETGQESGARMGTTLSLLFGFQKDYLFKHIGDSRIYHYRNRKLSQITKDHTWVQQEIDRGVLSFQDSQNHRMKHVLTKALGVEPSVQIDEGWGQMTNNSQFLLCSDGFYQYIQKDELGQFLERKLDVQEKINCMMEQIKSSTADDNATGALIHVKKSWFG